MKKLIIVLLVVMLSLGLSGIALAADQTVEGNVTATISITAPDAITAYGLVADSTPAAGDNTELTGAAGTPNAQDANDLVVTSNTPYHIQINCDTPAVTGATAGYMHKYDATAYVSPAFTLTKPFYWSVTHQDGTTKTVTSAYTLVTATAATIADIDDTATDDDGYATELTYSQPVHFSDPVLSGTNKYRIVITFTAVADSATG
jgi:hypothetical protein